MTETNGWQLSNVFFTCLIKQGLRKGLLLTSFLVTFDAHTFISPVL